MHLNHLLFLLIHYSNDPKLPLIVNQSYHFQIHFHTNNYGETGKDHLRFYITNKITLKYLIFLKLARVFSYLDLC